jgi:hypothetical protein
MNDFFIKTLLNFTLKDSDNEIYIPLEKAIEIFKQKFEIKFQSKRIFENRLEELS